jgi:hypothetical protein
MAQPRWLIVVAPRTFVIEYVERDPAHDPMRNREIVGYLRELYGIDVSPDPDLCGDGCRSGRVCYLAGLAARRGLSVKLGVTGVAAPQSAVAVCG